MRLDGYMLYACVILTVQIEKRGYPRSSWVDPNHRKDVINDALFGL